MTGLIAAPGAADTHSVCFFDASLQIGRFRLSFAPSLNKASEARKIEACRFVAPPRNVFVLIRDKNKILVVSRTSKKVFEAVGAGDG